MDFQHQVGIEGLEGSKNN